MLLLGETSDTLCQFARDSKSKACDSPDLRQNSEFFSFLDPFRKKICCIEDGKYSKK